MVKVKICGLTRFEDAAVAIQSGADYLGFILYPPSPRAVSPDAVRSLVADLKSSLAEQFTRPDPPKLVGVFVNQSAADIANVLTTCDLDMAQLSGNEDGQEFADLMPNLIGRVYKAIRPASLADAIDLLDRFANFSSSARPFTPSLLVDTPHQALYGGTGQAGDWGLAADIAALTPRLMLAGGLNPDNVAAAVQRVRPFAVDVAGGVEASPGVKNHSLVKAFIEQARRA